ncbi:hypothetical protein NDS46_12765 [Paenibacillus thiaminolyticus]|nr:hypothetical protein [Paenibacillus thiaminolyticus]WCF10658.1 hypothetical protein NDS46_12765 [Paenibacillus thiaminolyticus]
MVVPGIINNGGHYFYIDIDMYEDGMINCWELVDLRGLRDRDKIHSNGLSPSPAGGHLSVRGLGLVENANWLFNKESYFQYIIGFIHPTASSSKKFYLRANSWPSRHSNLPFTLLGSIVFLFSI